MPIPLNGFLQGDLIGLVIFADEEETVHSLARKVQRAASVRVRLQPQARVQVLLRGRALDPSMTVARAGFEPLDRFDVLLREL